MSAQVGAVGSGPLPAELPGPTATGGRSRRSWTSRLGDILPPLVVFVGVIVIWEITVTALDLKAFLFPRPTAIAKAFFENWGGGTYSLFVSWQATITEAIGGLVVGTAAGVIVALVTSRWLTARDALLPIAIAAGAVPIIAFAPLMNNWFGTLSPLSKMMMAAVLVFFPVMINVTRGLTQVEPATLELMRSYAAGEWDGPAQGPRPECLALLLHRPQAGHDPEPDRGDRRRILRWLVARPRTDRRPDLERVALRCHLGGRPDRGRHRDRHVPGVAVVERLVIPWHASMRSRDP